MSAELTFARSFLYDFKLGKNNHIYEELSNFANQSELPINEKYISNKLTEIHREIRSTNSSVNQTGKFLRALILVTVKLLKKSPGYSGPNQHAFNCDLAKLKVGELKEMFSTESKLPIESFKLVLKGKTLSDDSKFLFEYFKDSKDNVIHCIIVKTSAASDAVGHERLSENDRPASNQKASEAVEGTFLSGQQKVQAQTAANEEKHSNFLSELKLFLSKQLKSEDLVEKVYQSFKRSFIDLMENQA
jgi:hypothetical protein